MSNTSFPSRVDAWLVAIPLLGLGFALVQGYLLRASAPVGSLIAFAAAAFVVVIFLLVVVPCTYVLEAKHLLIRFGIFRRRIAYKDITGLELSSNPLSAPALSLRRVKVSCGSSYQLVSPRDREKFIRAVQERVTLARAA